MFHRRLLKSVKKKYCNATNQYVECPGFGRVVRETNACGNKIANIDELFQNFTKINGGHFQTFESYHCNQMLTICFSVLDLNIIHMCSLSNQYYFYPRKMYSAYPIVKKVMSQSCPLSYKLGNRTFLDVMSEEKRKLFSELKQGEESE